MSKVDLNPVFEGFARKMGNMVFYNRKGGTFVRRNTPPSNPNTPAQQSVRSAFTYTAELWKGSNGVLRASWVKFAKGKKYSGYNAFMAENAPRRRQGLGLELFREMGEVPLVDFAAQTGTSAGQASLEFTLPADAEAKHLTVFAQDNGTDGDYRPFRRFDLGAGAASPASLDGLTPGAPYRLYAVLTDAHYAGAATVSSSVTADVVAGS